VNGESGASGFSLRTNIFFIVSSYLYLL